MARIAARRSKHSLRLGRISGPKGHIKAHAVDRSRAGTVGSLIQLFDASLPFGGYKQSWVGAARWATEASRPTPKFKAVTTHCKHLEVGPTRVAPHQMSWCARPLRASPACITTTYGFRRLAH